MRSRRQGADPRSSRASITLPHVRAFALSRLAVVVLLGAMGLLAAGWSPARASTSEPGGTATIAVPTGSAPSGIGSATVHWSAQCPNPAGEKTHYWYVNSVAYHEDGSQANRQSTAESDSTSDSKDHGLVLRIAAGLASETFSVQVELICFPNPNKIIGNLAVTLSRNQGGTGAGGGTGTGGSGGGGAGGGPAGGGAGGGGAGGSIHCVVPRLAGRTLKKAKALLEAAHCKLGTVTAPRHRRGAKLVVRASVPKHGTQLPRGAKVRVRLRTA